MWGTLPPSVARSNPRVLFCFCVGLPLQVQKDASLEVASVLDTKGESAAKIAHGDWYDAAKAQYQGLTGDSKKDRPKAPKRFRTKAFKWLLCLDYMLEQLGVPLSQFALPPLQECLPNQPAITISLDQGSDGWCACNFLAGKLFCILILPDPSHRCWNDCRLALQDAGVWSAVHLLTICFNLDHGPWADARWYQECVEAVHLYTTLTEPSECPAWQTLYHLIAAESGDSIRMGEDGFEKELFNSLPMAYNRMSQKVAMARWFGWVDTAASMLKVWHRKLLVLLFLCVSLGHIDATQATSLVAPGAFKPLAEEAKEDGKPRTSHESATLSRLRRGSANAAALSLLVLADRSMWELAAVAVYVVAPVRQWHATHPKGVISADSVVAWYTRQSAGDGLEHLRQMCTRLQDKFALQDVGLGVLPPGVSAADLDLDHGAVFNDDRLAEQLGNLTLCTLSRRLASSLWYMKSLPGVLPALLDPAVAPHIIAWLRTVYTAWLAIKGRGGASWTKFLARSPFNLVYVQKVIVRDALDSSVFAFSM